MGEKLIAVLEEGIVQKITPGLAAAVGQVSPTGTQVWRHMAGAEVESYDLSSLTKIIATALMTAEAVVLKKIDLQETPWSNWPNVSIANVMNHTSGLPAWCDFYTNSNIDDQAGLKARIMATPLIARPGEQTIYSDIGFIALGFLLEERLGAPLEDIFTRLAQRYYERNDLFFVRTKCSRINDLNACALQGVSGHAGLFGSLESLIAVARWFITSISDQTSSIGQVLREFAYWPSNRGLGFDRPTADGSTGGVLLPSAIGHLGFTGTSLWMDLEAQPHPRFYILLTNRTYAGASLEQIKQLRIRFHKQASLLKF